MVAECGILSIFSYSAPSSPCGILDSRSRAKQLDTIEFVVVVRRIGLVQGCIKNDPIIVDIYSMGDY